mmetsp:Transcript_18702/g.35628  ORF Transcript_18702/g.35628 Transcript_18702/m.35628 type:complete len:213 (+) Transcript_18702:751-1389(+)
MLPRGCWGQVSGLLAGRQLDAVHTETSRGANGGGDDYRARQRGQLHLLPQRGPRAPEWVQEGGRAGLQLDVRVRQGHLPRGRREDVRGGARGRGVLGSHAAVPQGGRRLLGLQHHGAAAEGARRGGGEGPPVDEGGRHLPQDSPRAQLRPGARHRRRVQRHRAHRQEPLEQGEGGNQGCGRFQVHQHNGDRVRPGRDSYPSDYQARKHHQLD